MFDNTNVINFEDIFTLKNVVIYFLIINLIGFLIMLMDKRKAEKGKWRIPEKTLFIITALRWRNWYYYWNVCI